MKQPPMLRWSKLASTLATVSPGLLQHPSHLSQTWGTVFHTTLYKLCLTFSAFLQDQLFMHLQKWALPCPAGASEDWEKADGLRACLGPTVSYTSFPAF